MFSFWPSLSLLVFFLVIFLECRAIAGRVTLPLGSFLMVFCYGSIGAPLLALLLQQIPIFPDAGPASPATWLLGPPIEELAKALPVIVLAFLTRESRRLSIADLTLIGLASGAGFGFVEGNLNALVNGTLPGFQYLITLGLQSENGAVFFAGHAVTTALVGLAAGIGLRFLPPNIAYAWAPSAFVFLWTSFDHGIYNWKILNAADGVLPSAHFALELLHELTLKGQLATWVLPIVLIAAQLIEAYRCSKAVGVRRDLLLAREWRPWVANELLVALMRVPLGRAVFSQTLAYFRLRRAFYLAAFETRRDPKDPTLSRHARSLEDRLKRERSILFDPAPGTWLLPIVVLKAYALQWAWRMRWVLMFAVLLLLLFMLDPRSLPEGLRQVLFGEVFTIVVAIAGLAFAVWRIILFGRVPPPDPLSAEGTAFASHYTRQLLLGCSLVCGLFPSLAMLLGWKALAPGAAFIGGYLPGWIAQGGNLQTLLGLGAIGGAVAPDPRPAGEAFRHEIAAGEERIRRLGSEVESAHSLPLESFLEAMAKLDAERDAQARRQLILDGCERQASEATIRDPAPVVQSIKDEFDRLAGELLEAAAKDLDAMSSLEQDYARAWSQIMHDLDTHDALRRGLRTPLREAWQKQNDIGWALRVVQATDDGLLPMQLTLLPELREIATAAVTARSEIVAAGVERIRATAAEYGETDPFAFSGAAPVEDEATLLAEVASSTPSAEEPRPFGLRAPTEADTGADLAKDAPLQPASTTTSARGQHYQDALDQLIESSKRDTGYLKTIQHLERSDAALQQPIESAAAPAPHVGDSPASAPNGEHQGELEDLIDAIKRDSGYLAFAKDAPVTRGEKTKPADGAAAKTSDDADKAQAALSEAEREEQEKAAFAHRPAPVIAASVDPPAEPPAEVEAAAEAIDSEWAIAAAAYKQAQDQPTPSVEDASSVTGAAQEIEPAQTEAAPAHAPSAEIQVGEPEPAQAEVPTSRGDPIEPAEIEASAAVAEIATPAEPAPAQAESVIVRAERVEHTPPSVVAEIATPAEPAQAQAESVIVQAERVEHTPPSIAVEIAMPAERAPENAEALIALAEPVKRVEIEASAAVPETNTTEIAKPAEPEASAEPVQSEAPTAHAESIERAEIEALAARFAPQAKKPEPVEPPSRTETRASFFERLFEAAMRQTSDANATPASRDQSHDAEPKPVQSPVAPIARDQAVAPTTEKHDTEPQKASDGISAPSSEWLADFAALNADSAKAQTEATPLEKIEWPSLGQTTREEVPNADKSAGATSIPVDVAQPLEAQPVESAAPQRVVTETAPLPVESASASTESADATPVVELPTDPAKAAVQEPSEPATAAAAAPDAFASKVDRLSYLLEKLERAMQTAAAPQAAPAPQAEPPSPKPAEVADIGAHAQASEPATVEPEPAKAEPAADETPQPERSDNRPAMPVGEPAIAAEPTAVATEQAVVPQPPAEEPKAVAEAVSAIAPTESQPPSEAQQRPDRLSYLLTKLFETVAQDTERKPVAPLENDARPEADESAPPATATPDHPEASAVLDLRGPHPIAEPLDEPVHVASEPTPQEPESAKVEAQPEPVAPPAQVHAPVVEPPASTDATVLPTREDAKPTEVSQAEPPADASEAPRPAPEQPVQTKIRSKPSAQAAHFGSRKSQRSFAPPPFENGDTKPTVKVEAEPEPIAAPAQAHEAVVEQPASTGETARAPSDEGNPADAAPPAPHAEASEAVPAAEQPSEQPVHPKTLSRPPAPTTTFGSRKSPRTSTPAPLAKGQAKPIAKVEAEPEPIAPPAQAHAAVVDQSVSTGEAARAPSDEGKPADAAPPAEASEAPPADEQPSKQPVQPKTTSHVSAPTTTFGARKSPHASAPTPLANGEAKPMAKVEAEPEPIAPPAQAHAAVVDQSVSTGEAARAPSDEGKPADAAPPAPPAEASKAPPADEQPSEQPVQPKTTHVSAPTGTFGSRKSPHASAPTPLANGEAKTTATKRLKEPSETETPATTPRRDWKLTNGSPAGTEGLKSKDPEAAKKSEPSFRVKTGSGALATVDTAPTVSPAATATTPAKYYGPRYVRATDGEAVSDTHAQQRAVSLADALTDFYAGAGTPQPAMYTTDRATLHRIIASGKLDAPRRRGAPWSISGTSRRGEVVIRLKPGSETHVEFVPSTEIFGQVPHYYPRGVGKGGYQTHVPAEHLEYFDVAARQWAPLRG